MIESHLGETVFSEVDIACGVSREPLINLVIPLAYRNLN